MVQGVAIENGEIVNTNPATGEVVSRVKTTSPDEVLATVARAKAAQEVWSAMPLQERCDLLKKGTKAMEGQEYCDMMVKEMGKPMHEAVEEMEFVRDKDAFIDNMFEANKERDYDHCTLIRDPLGIVVVLSPWNYPADEILLLTLPALAAGNAVIVKPSEVTPEIGAMIINKLASFLPPDVLQLCQGDGEVGKLLVSNKDVNMVAMTGSTATGKAILRNCADDLKRVVLEMGGKDPLVVFGDADLDLAAKDAVEFSLCNAGQVCSSVERVYVDKSVEEDFQKKVIEYASKYTVGNGMEKETKVGPMVSVMQREKVAGQVESAVKEGAKLVFQSEYPKDTPNFFPVTVLAGVSQDLSIQKDETFGPVVVLSTFDGTEDEAARLANDSEYGLASYVYTTDMDKGVRLGRRIKSGQVGINCYAYNYAHVNCPW